MKIVDDNGDLVQEVSLGLNELFKEATKEKREEAERKLLYGISENKPENKTEPCVETVQEECNISVNTQSQNQVQPVILPQNAVVQGNQNGMISPAFSQRSELKERNYHNIARYRLTMRQSV